MTAVTWIFADSATQAGA